MDCIQWQIAESARKSWHYRQARYLGVAFQIKGKTHYGWMRLSHSSGAGATLTGYAYETIPGKSIKAGETKGSDDFTGEPNSASNDDPGLDAPLNVPNHLRRSSLIVRS